MIDMLDVVFVGVGAYIGLGLVVGIHFAFVRVQRVDPAALGAPWAFRVIIIPAVVALWPLTLALHAATPATGAQP